MMKHPMLPSLIRILCRLFLRGSLIWKSLYFVVSLMVVFSIQIYYERIPL